MKIKRDIDLRFRIGDNSLRIEDEVDILISAEEAVAAVFAGVEGKEVDEYHLKVLLNSFSQFIKAVPDETIAKLTPDARRLVAGFLQGTSKRFLQGEPEWLANEAPVAR